LGPPGGHRWPPTKARFSLDKTYRRVITLKISTSAINGNFLRNGSVLSGLPSLPPAGAGVDVADVKAKKSRVF
jgi:hypothetical protein